MDKIIRIVLFAWDAYKLQNVLFKGWNRI